MNDDADHKAQISSVWKRKYRLFVTTNKMIQLKLYFMSRAPDCTDLMMNVISEVVSSSGQV